MARCGCSNPVKQMVLLFVYKVQVRVKSVGVSAWYSVTFFLAYLSRVANTDPRKCIYRGSFNRENHRSSSARTKYVVPC